MDALDRFYEWARNKHNRIGSVPAIGAVERIGEVTAITWFRQPPFQVELFIFESDFIIPEHTHPNVDSYEVYVGGQVAFSHSGEWKTFKEKPEEIKNRRYTCNGKSIRVNANDTHGGIIGPEGGVFMSIQHWLNGEPHRIAHDWNGKAMDDNHMSGIKQGESKVSEKTWQDAAHLEENPPRWY
jgi:hypothetical protein